MRKLFLSARLLALAAVFSNPPASAQEALGRYPERETLKLDSSRGHGGSNAWFMQKADAGHVDGAALSKPDYAAGGWQSAIVPGTVLNSLVANGVFPEPYFGMNNQRKQKLIPDLSDAGPAFYTYWFRTTFAVPASFQGRRVWMQFDGINYTAEIWVNGHQVGKMAGMFNRGLFDITDIAKTGGDNAVAVLVHPIDPPNGFAEPKVTNGKAGNENPNGADGKIGGFTTMLMTAGWDFTFPDGIRDRNTGIWRSIKLFATGPVMLKNPFVAARLPIPSTASADLTVSVDVTNATGQPQTGVLSIAIPERKISLRQAVTLLPNETRKVVFEPAKFLALSIRNPRLWWPFNKGEQFLHHLELQFVQGGAVSDELKTRFGIRDIRSDQNTPLYSDKKLTEHPRIFYVNGKRFFLQGANWIPEAMLRTSEARTEAELRYTRQAGVNFLRLWGGGITESDDFFDLCDELGILVWVEFWQTGNTILPVDQDLHRANVEDTVKRIRNHPSLAYYVSANERTAKTIVPIQDLLAQLDGTRGYQAASEIDGIHDGSPYLTVNPMWYYEDTASPRGSRVNGLCPEYGTPILPTIDALREMMPGKDLWPIDQPTWDYLDGGGFHRMTTDYQTAVGEYGPSAGIEEYAWKAQMFGGLAYKALWEVWNANRFDYGDRFFCTGVLFWYLNSPNRQTCGRMWDWSLEPTAALYFSQSAHEPLHVQYDFLKNTIGINNELPMAFSGLTLTARILNLDLREVYRQAVRVNVPADRFVKNVLKVSLPANLSPVHFIKLTLTNAAGKVLSDNFYWRSNKPYLPGRTWTGPLYEGMSDLNLLPKVALKSAVAQVSKGGKNYDQVTVTNPSKSLAFMIWLRLQDAKTGQPIRPAFYGDNFFSLLPGESRSVQIEYRGAIDPAQTRLIVDGWNVARQQFENGKATNLPDTRAYH